MPDWLTERSNMDNWQVIFNCVLYAVIASFAATKRRMG